MSNSTNVKSKRKAHNALNTEKFIAKATAKHGDRYDYSKSVYTASIDKLIIICKTHGEFTQSPANHLTGNGCRLCANKDRSTQTFIDSARMIHGDRYDYSLVEYTGNSKKVKIKCKEHGLFEQRASNHLYWNGCKKCRDEKTRPLNRFSKEKIISQFIETHGDLYDYSLVDYKGVDTPVIIICKLHGNFKQAPYHHRKVGSGCPICTKVTPYSRTKYIEACNRYDGKSSLYAIQLSGNGELFYKVGITMKTVKRRFGKIPYKIKEIRVVVGDAGYIYDLETQLHRLLSKYHYKPKNSFGGCHLECFSEIPKSIIDLIDRIEKSKQLQLLA